MVASMWLHHMVAEPAAWTQPPGYRDAAPAPDVQDVPAFGQTRQKVVQPTVIPLGCEPLRARMGKGVGSS
ncbi:hypothetical protein [Actinomadura sp. 3N508]|uniref:hypothetical protein n=1 Tax=Actinomadura sp. 3N508 TaxID=3375153 RepID=UPI0037AE11E0